MIKRKDFNSVVWQERFLNDNNPLIKYTTGIIITIAFAVVGFIAYLIKGRKHK